MVYMFQTLPGVDLPWSWSLSCDILWRQNWPENDSDSSWCISISKDTSDWIFWLTPSLKFPLSENIQQHLRQRTQCVAPLSMPTPSPTSFLRHACFAFFLLSFEASQETCNQGGSKWWQLFLGWPPEPVSKGPLFASETCFWVHAAQLAHFSCLRDFLSNKGLRQHYLVSTPPTSKKPRQLCPGSLLLLLLS